MIFFYNTVYQQTKMDNSIFMRLHSISDQFMITTTSRLFFFYLFRDHSHVQYLIYAELFVLSGKELKAKLAQAGSFA